MLSTVKANNLIHEKSPYLLQHANNPINWYTWSDEAFAKANKECNRKHWGETTRSKEETSARNADIYNIYEEDTSVKSLSEMYYLSTKSIQKIIFRMKKENQ